MNNHEHFVLGYIPRSWILRSNGKFVCNFARHDQIPLPFHGSISVLQSSKQCMQFPFSYIASSRRWASLVAQLVKNAPANVGDLGLNPGLGRSSGEGNGYPLQYSGLENSMNCIVHGVTKSWTQLNNFHFTFIKEICCQTFEFLLVC